jgi:hypothetical protein
VSAPPGVLARESRDFDVLSDTDNQVDSEGVSPQHESISEPSRSGVVAKSVPAHANSVVELSPQLGCDALAPPSPWLLALVGAT